MILKRRLRESFGSGGREQCLSLLPGDHGRRMIRQLYGLLDAAIEAQRRSERLMVSMGRTFPEIARFMGVYGIDTNKKVLHREGKLAEPTFNGAAIKDLLISALAAVYRSPLSFPAQRNIYGPRVAGGPAKSQV